MTSTRSAEPVQYAVAHSDQVPERDRYVVDVGGTTVGIFRLDGRLHAYENVCAHQGGPVCQGRLVPRVREELDENQRTVGSSFDEEDLHIVCPWHGFEYSVRSGRHPGKPGVHLREFAVREQEGIVYVTV